MSVSRTDRWRDDINETELDLVDMGEGRVSVGVMHLSWDMNADEPVKIRSFSELRFERLEFIEWVNKAVLPLYEAAKNGQ